MTSTLSEAIQRLEIPSFSLPPAECRTNRLLLELSDIRPWGMPLPRYFFDTYDGHRFIADSEGIELKDIEMAKAEAQSALPDLARDALPAGDQKTFIVSVRDEAGQVVLRAALSLIVEITPENSSN
ncbi:DUF6894 family protein [Microvirga arabica]|uniref:DUF6894 family protein n=1 Tax=Microvirga arabica TaxID=1128671 RepID=A0ABV6YFU6_9HYPH